MSQRCHLTIYEPEKKPRVVELQINQSNSAENEVSVYNEDGTVLDEYQLYWETTDHQLIKVPSSNHKTKNKWKFWKKWVKTGCLSNSIVSDVPISESAHKFLKAYMVNSAKKEKKIARVKELRNAIADRKLKNKLKKQRKKEQNRSSIQSTFNGNCGSSPTLIQSKFSPVIDMSKRSSIVDISKCSSVINDNVQEKNNLRQSSKLEIRNVEQNDESNTQNVSPVQIGKRSTRRSRKRRRRIRQNGDKKIEKNDGPTQTERLPASSSMITNPSTSNQIVEQDSSSLRWKASEPALDFIPVTRSVQNECNEESNYFSSFNSSKNSLTYSRFFPNIRNNSHSRMQSCEDKFIGLSKKAFFLQC